MLAQPLTSRFRLCTLREEPTVSNTTAMRRMAGAFAGGIVIALVVDP